MTKKIISAFIALFFFGSVMPQAPQNLSAAEIYQSLQRLNVFGSVLYIAAHPDDENTRLLTYLSKEKLYRTGYLSLTRGDGGQNLIGDGQGIELGLIRTQELLAARRTDGGEQFFTRAYDFGYSKNATETFTKWDKEKILSDVVWVIRNFQPDIVINRFPVTGEGGHGHHTASGILANEAFDAAADPLRFPEQLKYVQVWQAKRILWNTFNFGGTNTTREDQFKIDVGGYNALLGKSYGEIAAESRSQHKSQGFGVPASRGESFEYFKTTKGNQPVNDLMDGVETGWGRIQAAAHIQSITDSLIQHFDMRHPERSVAGLVHLYELLETLPNGYWLSQKKKEISELIVQCSGLLLDVTTAEQYAVQTDSLRFQVLVNNRLGADVLLEGVQVADFDSSFQFRPGKNKNFIFYKTVIVPADQQITQPYWLRQEMKEGYYNVPDQLLIGNPDTEPAFTAHFRVRIQQQLFFFSRPVQFKYTDPVRGELYQPLVVVPPVLAEPDSKIKLSKSNNNFDGVLTLTSKKKGMRVVSRAETADIQDQTDIRFTPATILLNEKNNSVQVQYEVRAKSDHQYRFGAQLDTVQESNFNMGMKEIRHEHIPVITYFTEAAVWNKKLNIQVDGKRIGYITGAGDKVPDGLEQMGFEVIQLGNKELSRNQLKQFDAILTGVRAYNTHDWLNKHYEKLMNYVAQGGNLIVQYNTSTNLGPVKAKIAPYPFSITRTRVTDENAAVHILNPLHPVFNYPNKITADDFQGWVQERSIYHGSDTTGKFEKLISMSDPGEKLDEGSLLIARYGKGVFTYTGLVFFRQLPAGVPGAYRLLANLVALNKKKGF